MFSSSDGAIPAPLRTVLRGIGQVLFQARIGTVLLFLVGIALNDWRHASWMLMGSTVGMLVGSYHATSTAGALDPESLAESGLAENVALGLYGYNATRVAVARFLWRRSLIRLLSMLLSVPNHGRIVNQPPSLPRPGWASTVGS